MTPGTATDPGAAPLTWWEKLGLTLFALLLVAFGGLVLLRSAYQQQRKTDYGVYARAGWAVRAGADVYTVTDDRGLHYCYPPPFAIFMAPLADPPADAPDRAGYLPFGASVAVWYAVSVALLAAATHWLARAVLPDAVPGSRRWWYARMVPVYVCLAGIGFSLNRGQVNPLLVFLVAGMFVASVRGKVVRAGLWLGAAVALKVFPGFLALYPLARRDWRGVLAAAAGSALFLVVIPAAVWGVDGAVRNNVRFAELILLPGTLGGGDRTRGRELTDVTASDNQSFQAVVHNLRHPDPLTRPPTADRATKLAHWALVGVLTVVTLAAGRRAGPGPADQLLFLGALATVMLLATPMSHLHYFMFALPLVAGVWLKGLAARPGRITAGGRTTGVLFAWGVLTAVPLFPYGWLTLLRESGLAPLATIGLWAFGLAEMVRRQAEAAEEGVDLPGLPELAPRPSASSRAA